MQYGLFIEKVSISNLQLQQLYIKWDEKIELSVKEVTILPQTNKNDAAIDYEVFHKSLKVLVQTFDWFSDVVIQKAEINGFDISFSYKENSKGFLKASSPTLLLTSSVTNEGDILKLSIQNLEEETKKISLVGDLYLDINTQEIYAQCNTLINKDANLTIYTLLNAKKIHFFTESQNDIKDIKAIIKLAKLPQDLNFWAHDAISVQKVNIESLKGKIDFSHIDEAYKNIYLKAKASNLSYTYNRELKGINSAFTELEFLDGVFYVKPKDAYSYGSNLGESWLKIDFREKEELLTLYLLFDTPLNKEMLEILSAYKIKLPFLQKSGFITSDLTLLVNLTTLDVDAQGKFKIQKGNFDYLGLNLDISDAEVLLNNYDVKIPSMRASYKNIANAEVQVEYDAKASEGKIDFLFDSINLDEIKLNSKDAKLHASYVISPLQDTLQIEKSLWNVQEHLLSVDALEIPFDLATLKVLLPTTYVELKGVFTAFISGEFDIKTFNTEMLVDLLTLSYKGINLSQSNTPFLLKYTDKLSIKSPENLFFNIAGTEYLLEKPVILANAEEVVLKNSKLTVGKYATTKIYVKHDLNSTQTHVSLSDLNVTDAKKEESLFNKKKVLLSIKNDNDMLVVNSDELGATFTSNTEGWELYINSLSGVVADSEFLQKFNIDTGEFTLYKEQNQHNVGFSASIIYPYKLLTQDDIPTNNYAIEGEIKEDTLSLVINKNTSVFIGDDIQIDMKKTGINVNEVINAIGELQTDEDSNESITLNLNAIDSYLYIGESRKAPMDKLLVQYSNKVLTAQLLHKEGKAGLRLQDKKFHLHGKDFKDSFMNELFSPSRFKDGNLEFSVNGTTDEYSGILYITNTTILSYKLLNNILAFINTVPSLMTFSLPGYSSKGIFAKEGYINFQAKNKIYTLSDIYLKSKELNILGKGTADFNKDTLDVKLNLQTDLGSDASQIPLVGYILFDKESVSTTINLKGDLKDPEIESLLAQDIAVAPLNIIKRTLSLPYDLFKNMRGDTNSSR